MVCDECTKWRYFWHLDREYPFTTDIGYGRSRETLLEQSNSTRVGVCIERLMITGNKSRCFKEEKC
jgi:hypothetical protein